MKTNLPLDKLETFKVKKLDVIVSMNEKGKKIVENRNVSEEDTSGLITIPAFYLLTRIVRFGNRTRRITTISYEVRYYSLLWDPLKDTTVRCFRLRQESSIK